MDFSIVGLDHVQLTMPPGRPGEATSFYVDFLGMKEVFNPGSKGGLWFRHASFEIHLKLDPDHSPANKIHIALKISNLEQLLTRCSQFSIEVYRATSPPRFYITDPFGNKIELVP